MAWIPPVVRGLAGRGMRRSAAGLLSSVMLLAGFEAVLAQGGLIKSFGDVREDTPSEVVVPRDTRFVCPIDSQSSSLVSASTTCPDCRPIVEEINRTIGVIQRLETRMNQTIGEVNQYCADGEDVRDVPPSLAVAPGEEPESYCGPDVTAAMMAAMARVHQRMKNLPDNEKGLIDASDPFFTDSFLMRNAGNADQKPRESSSSVCPAGKCAAGGNDVGQNCFTFFGQCVPQHVLNVTGAKGRAWGRGDLAWV